MSCTCILYSNIFDHVSYICVFQYTGTYYIAVSPSISSSHPTGITLWDWLDTEGSIREITHRLLAPGSTRCRWRQTGCCHSNRLLLLVRPRTFWSNESWSGIWINCEGIQSACNFNCCLQYNCCWYFMLKNFKTKQVHVHWDQLCMWTMLSFPHLSTGSRLWESCRLPQYRVW